MNVGISSEMNMGERIRKKRKSMGYKQEELAKLLHIGRTTYNAIERGNRPLKDEEIVKIANILQTSCDYILTGTETANLDICEALNLSNQAVSTLKGWKGKPSVWKDGEGNTYYEQDVSINLAMLEKLITSREGNTLLQYLYLCISCDFSKIYTYDQSKDEMEEIKMGAFIRHFGSGKESFTHLTPETIGDGVMEQIKKELWKLLEAWREEYKKDGCSIEQGK